MLNLKTIGGMVGAALAVASWCMAGDQTLVGRLAEGQNLRQQGQFEEAQKVLAALVRDARKNPDYSRFAAIATDSLGLTELEAGSFAAAETSFNQALSSLRPSTPDDSDLMAVKTHLAELYIAELRPAEAEALARQVAAALRAASPMDPLALARAYDDIAVARIMQHKFAEIETMLREAMALVEEALGPDDPKLASCLLTYAGLLIAEHHFQDAAVPAQRAWQILRESQAAIAKGYLASAAIVLSSVYYHTDRLNDSVSYAQQSVALAEEGIGPLNPRMELYLVNYAKVLQRADRKKEAKEIQKRADAIAEAHPPGTSQGTGYTINVAALR